METGGVGPAMGVETGDDAGTDDSVTLFDPDEKFVPSPGFKGLPLSLLDAYPAKSAQAVPNLSSGEEERSCESTSSLCPLEASLCDPEEVCFPSLDRYGGKYQFSATISQETKKRPTFSKTLNTFFVQSQTNFTVQFSVETERATPGLRIQGMVCYCDPAVLSERGPISPCSCNAHVTTRRPEYGDRFFISTSKKAVYSTKAGHKTVSIKLDDMQVVDERYTAVYSYASYTSCLAKNSRVATVFSLIDDNDVEVGRDIFYCSVCACPPRDMVKAEAKQQASGEPSHRRTHKRPREPDALVPSEGGYYLFQWRTKCLATYQMLCALKKAYLEFQAPFHNQQ